LCQRVIEHEVEAPFVERAVARACMDHERVGPARDGNAG